MVYGAFAAWVRCIRSFTQPTVVDELHAPLCVRATVLRLTVLAWRRQ